jgi:hypothetical protein
MDRILVRQNNEESLFVVTLETSRLTAALCWVLLYLRVLGCFSSPPRAERKGAAERRVEKLQRICCRGR